MDSFNFCNIKVENANAMLRDRQLQKILNLCRAIEVCVVLVLISRLTMQLPRAVKNSNGPCFLFVVGNAIIITLFAESGQFSARDPTAKTSAYDLYEELLKNGKKNQKNQMQARPCSLTSRAYLMRTQLRIIREVRVTRRIQTWACVRLHAVYYDVRRLRNCSYPEEEMGNESSSARWRLSLPGSKGFDGKNSTLFMRIPRL
ncbi:hypothetical protein CJ030_MR7G011624 [Morella rubra]|uniref:Uncharacterized protein n=1 Tax=Morella rubra TaxID=262757 RepID=A0A6A1V3S7_9ROSI|nr:hypothetical protein CJ030_MR7G011624 [Morella rubra]